MCEATFRSSTPRSYLNITYPVYAEVNSSIELKANGKGKLEIVKPVPQDLQPLVIELQEIYRKKQDPTDLAEYRR